MGILISLIRAGSLITSFLVPSIEAALRIRALFDLDPSYTVNLYSLTGSALAADDVTLAAINEWRASKGLPTLLAPVIQSLAPGTAVAMPVMLIPPGLALPLESVPAKPADPPKKL